MAGPYRVSFDFLEVVRFDPALKPDAPYQSWGTEYVFVAEDRGEFIALQHILVMRVQQDGRQGERADRRAPLAPGMALPGGHRCSPTKARTPGRCASVPADRRRGAWVQSVYQVDDSPRYAASGRWEHSDSFSTWISDETWRPLPRREFSVRKDYQVLVGTNRHTITPTGWVQEENNLKLALDGRAKPRARCRTSRANTASRATSASRTTISARARTTSSAPSRSGPRCAPPGGRSAGAAASRSQTGDQGQLFVPFFDYADKLADGEPFELEDAQRLHRQDLARDLSRSGLTINACYRQQSSR